MTRRWLAGAAVALMLQGTTALAEDMALVDAVRGGDRGTAVELIERGVDVNVAQRNGTTPLHWAVYQQDLELVERLLAAGADVDASNRYGSTPMAEAATAGNLAVLRALLSAGADVESPNSYGQTALMLASRHGDREAVSLLLEHGANVNAVENWRGQTALMWASARGNPEVVRELLKHGAHVDVRDRINEWGTQVSGEPRAMHRPSGGFTALQFAAREGCVGCARALLEAGAEVDLADPDGITPLMTAIDNFHFDLAKLLIEADASPSRWDWWGRTPLYLAVDVNTMPRSGRPDQPSLDETESIEIVRMLLDRGANPNAQLKLLKPYRAVGPDRGGDTVLTTGATPLLRAAKSFDTDSIRLLLEYGAKVDLPNVAGLTPLMSAAGFGSRVGDTRGRFDTSDVQRRSIAALELLIDAGADINARAVGYPTRFTRSFIIAGRAGQTALHSAASWGWNDVVAYLVDQGARLDIEDERGRTVLDAASGRAGFAPPEGHPATIELVERLKAEQVAGPAS